MFEWFTTKKSDSRRFEKAEGDLRDLKSSVEALERSMKSISLEWEETYDKMKHLMARITKRAQTADREKNDDTSTAPDARRDENGGPQALDPSPVLGTHSRLQEMRRRRGLLQG